MTGPSDPRHGSLGSPASDEALAPQVQPDRAALAQRVAEQVQLRLRQTVDSRAAEESSLDAQPGGPRGPTHFWLRLHTPEPERSLSITIDPIAGTFAWAYHYAGALMRGQTLALRDVDADYIDETVRQFEDDMSWRKGRFAIRVDRVSGARE